MLLSEDRIDTAFFSYEPGSLDGLIHNDHLATPQKMTDSSGAVVWAADYKPFGEATITVSTITNNLRFPGQYFDAETGLNYNYMRDYNPVIGRYIETDPVGLRGGINLYLYAGANSLRFTDPIGLAPCVYGCHPGYQTLSAIATDRNRNQCPYITCIVKCETRVLIGEIRDAMLDRMIEETAKRVAKAWAIRALPYYGWYSTSMTVYDAVECLVNCYRE
jgi:RHS repeat-associated protein